mgnify:CR=1 FL=1
MAGLEEKLCPVCFQEAMEHGECRNCGYHAEEPSAVKDYLAPFTILKEKYLLGKSLGQGGFGITYLAENMTERPTLLHQRVLPVRSASGEDTRWCPHPGR